MDETQRRVDEVRKQRSELENHIVDEYRAGKISRREFVRRGTVVGMSIPLVSFLAAACGGEDEAAAPPAEPSEPAAPADTGATEPAAPPPATEPAAQAGGTVRVALIQNTTEPNPLLVQDEGGAGLLGVTGEFLSFSDANLELQPRLAESWEPNADGSVWTFAIRQGVTFHDGTPLTANDVVQTFEKLINPDGGSANAQSALGGVLSPGGIEAPDDATVVFNLDAPNGNFPTLVSSANYNAIIIPADLDPNEWGQTFMGTGPFKFESFTPQVGLTVVRNDAYWGTPALRRQARRQALRGRGGDGARAPGRRGRLRRALLRRGRQGAARGSERPGHRRPHGDAPAAAHAHRHGAVHRQASPPGDRDVDRQAGAGRGSLGGPGRPRQRQPVRASVPVDRHVGGPARAGHRAREAADGRRRHGRRLRGPARHLGRVRDSRPGPARQELRRADRRHHQPQHHRRGHLLRRRRLRQLDLARLGHGHHRLRPPSRAERLPHGLAARGHREPGRLELRALPEPDVRPARDGLRRGARPRFPARGGKADPGAPPGRDAGRRSPYFYNFLSAAKPNLQGAISAATGQFDLSQASFTA